MSKLPSRREAKTHASHIAHTFNLKLTEAQEIVSYIYNCSDWAELVKNENLENTKGNYCFLSSKSELDKFDEYVSPHIYSIKAYIENGHYIQGSLLERVAFKDYRKIPNHIITGIVENYGNVESSELIDMLGYSDETFNSILHRKQSSLNSNINANLVSVYYGQSFYAYYTFNKNNLYVLSREWDLHIFRPSDSTDATLTDNIHSVCSRKWYVNYMIGYLKQLVQQFRLGGYSGKVRICRIQNSYVSSFFFDKPDKYSNGYIDGLFEALLDLGGVFAWDTDSQGNKIDIGIEIPFNASSIQWMIGEGTL